MTRSVSKKYYTTARLIVWEATYCRAVRTESGIILEAMMTPDRAPSLDSQKTKERMIEGVVSIRPVAHVELADDARW